MRRLAALILLSGFASLAGCATDPGPDVAVYDGPYYYDGRGYYYDDLRSFDYDYDRRYVYGRTYYYPGPYPYAYGGYRGDRHDRPDTDYRRPDNNATADRQRDRSPPPRDTGNDRQRERVIQGTRSKAATEQPNRPTRSDANRGGPRGGKR